MSNILSIPNLPDRLRDALKSSPTPIDELAEKTGIAIGSIKLFCLGSRPLPPDDLDRLALLLLENEPDAAENASPTPTVEPTPSPSEREKTSVVTPSRDDTPPSWARPFEPGEAIRYVNGIKQWMPKRPPPSRGIGFPEFYKNEKGRIFEGRCLNPAFFARPGNKIVAATWNKTDYFPIRERDLPPGFPPETAIFEDKMS